MTDIRKSDAQLDAEAEEPLPPPCYICGKDHETIQERLDCHRDAYRADCVIPKLVSRQPPTVFDYNKAEWKLEEGAVSGMPMAGPMIRRLSENPGPMYPWVTSFGYLRRLCRIQHWDHRSAIRPYWRGSLCWEIVKLTVIGGEKSLGLGPLSIEVAAGVLRITESEERLGEAFDIIEEEMRRIEARAAKRERLLEAHALPVNAPAPSSERHDQGGLHATDCPRCRKGAVA